MAANIIPDKLIDYALFLNGDEKLGTGDVSLPDLEAMTETVKGNGINGEVEMPTLGMLGKLPLKISWRTITRDLTELAAPKAHDIEARGAQQHYDSGTGEMIVRSIRVVARALPKKTGLGKFAVASTTGSSTEMECVYFKMEIDGKTVIEIDKFARICNINGKDYFASVKAALGIK